MFVQVKQNGKIIACYRADFVVGVEYKLGTCAISLIEDRQCIVTMTDQDFSDLISQLNAD